MKRSYRIIPLIVLTALGLGSFCQADMAHTEDGIPTTVVGWFGFNLDHDSTDPIASYADSFPYDPAPIGGNPYTTATRTGTTKAYEWQDLDRTVSGGLLLNTQELPQRLHIEADINSDKNWFGDLRYSYEDIFMARVLPRRFVHHLDNINYADLDITDSSQILIYDFGESYGQRIDIDTYKLRLKTPNFPWHFYSKYEQVRRDGDRQFRFLGGNGYRSPNGQDKATKQRDVDQDTNTVTFGTNAHLRWVEADYSHTDRMFSSSVPSTSYFYNAAASGKSPGVYNQDVLPELKASTNTVKVHTSLTGEVVASATVSRIDRKNDNSQTKAVNTMGEGEVVYALRENLSFAAKYRYLDIDTKSPGWTVLMNQTDGTTYTYTDIRKGVGSVTHSAELIARYRPLKGLILKGQYAHRMKDNDTDSANEWSRADEISSDIYQAGAAWRACRNVKIDAKFVHINTDFDWTTLQLTDPDNYERINKDPEKTNQGTLGLTWTPTHKLTALLHASWTKETTDENHVGLDQGDGKSRLQRYLASLNYVFTERLSMTGSYAYMSAKNEGLMIWEDNTGEEFIDPGYNDKQVAQTFSLGLMATPTDVLTLNAAGDYTITDGDYTATQILAQVGGTPYYIGDFSQTKTKEVTYHMDGEYDLGMGLSAGLELQYTYWKDQSFDNPAKGSYTAGLLKLRKVF